jgi:hypothetical protein
MNISSDRAERADSSREEFSSSDSKRKSTSAQDRFGNRSMPIGQSVHCSPDAGPRSCRSDTECGCEKLSEHEIASLDTVYRR